MQARGEATELEARDAQKHKIGPILGITIGVPAVIGILTAIPFI